MSRRYSTLATYRNLLLSGLVFLMGLVSTSTFAQDQAAQDPKAAEEFINKLSNDAVAVWSDASRTEAEREEAFRDLLYEGFDVDFIAKLVLGRHMRTASKEQLREYQELFPAYIVNNFARRIGNYGDEKLEVEGTTPAGSRDLFVRSKIVRPGGEPISADWRMRSVNGKLQIVDIKVEGISLAVTQRDEFSSIIERKGFDGLLDTLRKGALISTEG
ncbi:toluene tolerance protein [Iodidimonas muriae]|uniref:Toluene tolerance protein n=1 Tax=Iodidimonas muriae TaxID=261467 RepID=A0ABQ2LGD3_9PROT|nr:ABC transporter substrate-binding protein [Iodidimonas muriae]GER07025.1 toluene tolerance protein [Kordiimonadales bacterium JCM 17843]GGO13290.1 toluene tolerance protein [Iodidimonas muriae]